MKLNLNYSRRSFFISLVVIFVMNLSTSFSSAKKFDSTVYELLEKITKTNLQMPVKPKINTNITNLNKNTTSVIDDLNDPKVILEEWMMIESDAFSMPDKFPPLNDIDGTVIKIKTDSNGRRVNENYARAKTEGAENRYYFWFKLRGKYMFYSSGKGDINIIDSIFIKKVRNISFNNKSAKQPETCFVVSDYAEIDYKICALHVNTKFKWMCALQKVLNQPLDSLCPSNGLKKMIQPEGNTPVNIKRKYQSVVIIPLPSPKCNENWGYESNGNNWECTCAEGQAQSPVLLPKKEQAILLNISPMFHYDFLKKPLDSVMDKDKTIVVNEHGMIKITHNNFGKIIAPDGGVFKATEIHFHTPAEHQIGREKYEMEMQVIHYGISKADISKQVLLSFLFKSQPGIYNKFLDHIDFFNLPNPIDKTRVVMNDVYIPYIFDKTDDPDSLVMKPFSFYTYRGSLTSPPCTERTINYVVADPIPLSNTVIEMFKEALSTPNMIDDITKEVDSEESNYKTNNRVIQPLNGRVINFYDRLLYGTPEYIPRKRAIVKKGHYEKRIIDATDIVYIDSPKPSGIPGAFIVPQDEAIEIEEQQEFE